VLAIPDGIFEGSADNATDEDRRNDIIAKLSMLGVQTAEDMRLLALRVYGLNVLITTPTIPPESQFPFTFPFEFDNSARESRYTIIVTYLDLPFDLKFPYTFPLQFLTREIAAFENLIRKVKPANVDVFVATGAPEPELPLGWFPGNKSMNFTAASDTSLVVEPFAHFHNWDFNDTFTIMAWVKPNDDGGNGFRNIFEIEQTGGDARELQLSVDFTGGSLDFGILIREPNTGNRQSWAFGSYTFDSWFQVIVTWDGSTDTIKMYVDSVEDGSPTMFFNDPLSTLPDWEGRGMIGAFAHVSGPATDEYQGLIHQVALWNSVLTQTEITAIYNSGAGGVFDLKLNQGNYASADNLVHWYNPGLYLEPKLGHDLSEFQTLIDCSGTNNLSDSDIVNDSPT
jgi:hypothetical protein